MKKEKFIFIIAIFLFSLAFGIAFEPLMNLLQNIVFIHYI
jgi:hypothetical protein